MIIVNAGVESGKLMVTTKEYGKVSPRIQRVSIPQVQTAHLNESREQPIVAGCRSMSRLRNPMVFHMRLMPSDHNPCGRLPAPPERPVFLQRLLRVHICTRTHAHLRYLPGRNSWSADAFCVCVSAYRRITTCAHTAYEIPPCGLFTVEPTLGMFGHLRTTSHLTGKRRRENRAPGRRLRTDSTKLASRQG